LPNFAALVAGDKTNSAGEQWNRALLRATVLLAPVAALLVALGAPLITVLFQRGAFDAQATQTTAGVLAGLALGLPLRGIGGLVVRGMPAFKTRRLPLTLSALSTGVSIGLAFVLLNVFGLFGVALAVSLGDGVFALVGALAFWRRLNAETRATLMALAKISAAALAVGMVSYLVSALLASAPPFARLLIGGIAGVGVWLALAWMLDLPEQRALTEAARVRLRALSGARWQGRRREL
jgi:putative peptidoglycan lipid II flippase